MGKIKTVYEDCDILVVGGGMAGINSESSENGLIVIKICSPPQILMNLKLLVIFLVYLV